VLEWSKKTLYNLENDLPIARMYFPHIPKNINEFQTHTKKNIFLSILLPIALRGNELVLEERNVMKAAFLSKNIYKIEYLAKKYKVKDFKNINFSNITTSNLSKINKELSIKINKIPISLILAQSIIESGWGSSRFAQEGNALFGEWTWKTNVGIKPKGNLDANFAVKNFKNLLESLNSYILNLNSHPAYSEMRKFRALKYKMGKKITGYETANFLNKYAEIGFEYVIKIEDMIKSNRLYKFQKAKLEHF
jgi:Bax protein